MMSCIFMMFICFYGLEVTLLVVWMISASAKSPLWRRRGDMHRVTRDHNSKVIIRERALRQKECRQSKLDDNYRNRVFTHEFHKWSEVKLYLLACAATATG